MNPTQTTGTPQAIDPSQPYPQTYTEEQKHEPKPSKPVQYNHPTIYVQEQPATTLVMVPTREIDQDEVEASSAFTMSICFSILFTCFGCVCISSIPFLFVWVMYRKSKSERARRIASLSMLTFWILLAMNICFIVITICVVAIVPPVVIYTKPVTP